MLIELPVLVAVATEPVPAVIVPLVGETHGDAVVAVRPYLLDQPVVELLIPLASKERLNGLAPLEELRAITPAAADGIGQRHPRRIACVPGVLGHARLLGRSLCGEGRQWWPCHRFLTKFGKLPLPEVKRMKNLPLIPVLWTPVHDPDCVKTCTDQKSLESNSRTP